MPLRRFALHAAGGYRGRDCGDNFVRELVERFEAGDSHAFSMEALSFDTGSDARAGF